MTLRLSNSEMSTFRRCRRKWWLSYHRGLIPRADQPHGSPISVGNLVHDALAMYYDPVARLDPVIYAQSRVYGAIEENPGFDVEILKEWDLVRVMLEGYLIWLEDTGADSDLRLMGSERIADVYVTEQASGIEGGFSIISKLDAPVEQISDGAKLALEHKTVQSLNVPLETLKIDSQLLTEHLVRFMDSMSRGATAEEASDECHGILYNMLRKVKQTARSNPPFYGRETVPHNIYELRNHWKHVVAIAKEITHTQQRLAVGESHHDVAPPSPDRSCNWQCQFHRICPMFDDGSRVEDAVEAMFEVGNPLERYEGAEDL